MSSYTQFNFYTAKDIYEKAKELLDDNVDKINMVVQQLNDELSFVSFSYVEKREVSQKSGELPEFSVENKQVMFSKVETNLYTDSKEYFIILSAKERGKETKDVLDEMVTEMFKAEHEMKKQAEEFGGIVESRVEADHKDLESREEF